MESFIYRNPTEILFGKGMIAEISSRVPVDRPVLMVWGGGSIKKNGVYDQVKAALAGHQLVEFGGIEPNPLHETCMRSLALVKDFHSLNMPIRLKDFGIDAEDAARKVGERFASRKSAFGEQGDITADAAAQILRARA